jgi:hypothetical protein
VLEQGEDGKVEKPHLPLGTYDLGQRIGECKNTNYTVCKNSNAKYNNFKERFKSQGTGSQENMGLF